MDIESLVVFQELLVGPVIIEKDKIYAQYKITKETGDSQANKLIFKYQETVFSPTLPESQNIASMVCVQVAINYGLFFRNIVFDGLFDDIDKRFIISMVENTSREIYVNKLLFPNEFIRNEFLPVTLTNKKKYTASKITFINTRFSKSGFPWKFYENYKDRYVILSSGGKDSLLTYGILKELKKETHPVFVNESGRHWFTALNAYRYLRSKDPDTAKVWSNCDRIYTWMLYQFPFVKKNLQNIRSDIYPIRLWTVGVFLFGVLPLCIKRKAGRILIGDEYDCSQKSNFKGITHYNALYDQSKYFDNNLTRYFLKKGWNINQFSILRSLSELLIEKILSKRYPELQEQQISCHAAHEKINRMYPCGKCEKCRRIVGMLMALKISPKKCGYSEEQIKTILEQLTTKKVKQIGSDAAYLYYLLSQNNLIKLDDNIKKLIKNNFYVMNLRFDKEKSNLTDMPQDIRFDVLKIFLEYTDGAVKRYNYKWNAVDILNDPHMNQSYPFEISLPKREKREFLLSEMKSVFWEKSTWEEINERLKCVDTAILPCGSIEQHGPHLPVDVDYYDVVYLAQKVVEACSEPKPFIVPAIPYGVSYHHDDFKGTISVSNNSLSLFVYDIGVNLARNGIKKIIILNGHGDNAPTLNFAAQMINRDAHIFVCVESGESSDPDLAKLINTPNDIHAGEIETSTTLAIRPDYVRMEKAVDNTLTFGSNYMDFSSKRGVPWYVRTKKISRTGIMGNPTKATAEKGKNMWEIMITHLVRFVEEVKTTKLEDLYHKKI